MNKLAAYSPIGIVLLCIVAFWYAASVPMNWDLAQSLADDDATRSDIFWATQGLDRPLVPAPHQVAMTLYGDLVDYPINSPRSLVFHAGVTAASAGLGLLIAIGFGLLLAIGIVQLPVLDRALMPWVIASQTVPVLAIAPMVVVVLGNAGLTGILPKALIAGWLSFFPDHDGYGERIALARVQCSAICCAPIVPMLGSNSVCYAGLRRWGFCFRGSRWPWRLPWWGRLWRSYRRARRPGLAPGFWPVRIMGQTLQIWAVLVAAAALALLATAGVDVAQALTRRLRGGRL